MSDFKISRLKYTWKGQWSAGTNYLNDDIVRFGARIYVCISQHAADTNFYDDLNFLNSEKGTPLSLRQASGFSQTESSKTTSLQKMKNIPNSGFIL